MAPQAHIIAGSNGSGKTTFAREFLPRYAHCREFLNTDLVAAGLSPFDPDTAAVAAGRVLLARMKELIRQGKSFGFETTLAGKTYERVLRDMKARGYGLRLFYLWLPSADMAVARVARRVAKGGHNVPEDVIRRRADIGLQNLFQLYLPLFDSWFLFDSSTLEPRMVARYERGKTEVFDSDVYHQIITAPRK
jgi:predicted ABC-type ATPase